ncbi:hypothetical protein LIA77_06479 [Sarocladium implicatum]|nr:hypothetical protein LIA77_06479 [Sarocladium implicatum]
MLHWSKPRFPGLAGLGCVKRNGSAARAWGHEFKANHGKLVILRRGLSTETRRGESRPFWPGRRGIPLRSSAKVCTGLGQLHQVGRHYRHTHHVIGCASSIRWTTPTSQPSGSVIKRSLHSHPDQKGEGRIVKREGLGC